MKHTPSRLLQLLLLLMLSSLLLLLLSLATRRHPGTIIIFIYFYFFYSSYFFIFIKLKNYLLYLPGFEPGFQPWEGYVVPLHHRYARRLFT